MTKSGYAIGTFQYMAPERLGIGADEDARSDIYSLACVLYQCLTGSPPFPGETMAQLVAAHLSAPPPRPSVGQPKVPVPIDGVIARGMAKDPAERYATTVELANAAREAITEPIRRPAPTTRVQPPIEQTRPAATTPAYAYDAGPRLASGPWAPPAIRRGVEPPAPDAPLPPTAAPPSPTTGGRIGWSTWALIILGIILLIAGLLFGIPILWTIGVVFLVIGLALMAIGMMRRPRGEQRPRRSLKWPLTMVFVVV